MKDFIQMIQRWGEMPPKFYERLRELVVTVELQTRDILNKDGEDFQGMYFLESGHLWCFKDMGAIIVVWYMEGGKGNSSVPPPAKFESTKKDNEFVQALSNCTLTFVSGESIATLIQEFPELKGIVRKMTERMWEEAN